MVTKSITLTAGLAPPAKTPLIVLLVAAGTLPLAEVKSPKSEPPPVDAASIKSIVSSSPLPSCPPPTKILVLLAQLA